MTQSIDAGTRARTLGIEVTVAAVIDETADARTIVLDWPHDIAYQPGQFITVRIPSEQTGSVARSYSLSTAPGVDPLPAITVKRTRDGYGSNWLCDNAVEGLSLHILEPAGTFTPHRWAGTLRLFAAGSGVTPVMSILTTALAQHDCRVALFYANRDDESIIFGSRLAELAELHSDRLTVNHWLESDRGLPDRAALAEVCHFDAEDQVFICGPAPFMDLVESAVVEPAAGRTLLDRSNVHIERYVSLTGDPFTLADAEADAAPASVTVVIDGESSTITCGHSTPLIDAMLTSGIDAPYSCREGDCGSCVARLTSGRVEPGAGTALEPEDIDDGYILTCQAKPVGSELSVEFE